MPEELLDMTMFDKSGKATTPVNPVIFTNQDILNELNTLFKIYQSLPNRITKEDADINTAATLVKGVIAARKKRGV